MAFEYEEALFRLDLLAGERLPEIACEMLDAGLDGQAIRELAGLHRPTLRDASDLFDEALRVVGRPRMTVEEAKTAQRLLGRPAS